ncbi:hypothetical protein AB0K11_15400 [Mycobacterium sp. NPDC050551]|uniref:hypothetical protein n=1 Tax=Mycobacterium sp. NPDC050551 TaxID=3155407 RepID=UPI00342FE661
MSTPVSRARWMRGGLVGVCSTVFTTGAHAAAGGGLPKGSALVVAALVCLTVGGAVGGLQLTGRRTRPVVLTAALAVAQLLGHLVMAGGHHHAGGAGLSRGMIAAHLAAAVVLGVAISAVEYAYVVAASVLRWLRLFATATAGPVPAVRRWTTNVAVVLPVLPHSGLGMRAPPAGLLPAA